jgi:hypothetical protein
MEIVLVFIHDTSSLQRLLWGLYLGAEVVLVVSGHHRYVTIEMRFNIAFASHPSPKETGAAEGLGSNKCLKRTELPKKGMKELFWCSVP